MAPNQCPALSPPILSVEGVTFGYSPDHILLRDVDFGLHLSSRVSIVGPNGVGKSTLVKLIEGRDAHALPSRRTHAAAGRGEAQPAAPHRQVRAALRRQAADGPLARRVPAASVPRRPRAGA